MAQFWEVSARKTASCLLAGLAVTNVLVLLTHTIGWWYFGVLLFVCVTLLPGAAILRSLRITFKSVPVGLLYSFGLSLLVLMLSGLLANQILPVIGVERPLELVGILAAWNTVTLLLIGLSIYTNQQPMLVTRWHRRQWPVSAWVLLGFSFALPFLAALGAFRLNNGSDALFAQITLGYAAVLIVLMFTLRRRLPDELLTWLIIMLGLTVLLMTSLRGWDIVGHDIQREFRVYTLTEQHGRWDIALNRDPYNACLSITILPVALAKLLNISGLWVFKLVLQVVFAACCGVVYILLRRYARKLGALVGGLLFICYPTFINDSAMLTRQGVAYLFFALAIMVVSNATQRKRYKVLFVLCAMGAVLSHYSTAYMFVGLFGLAVVCKRWITIRQALSGHKVDRSAKHTVLSPIFAGLLLLMTFVWYAQITATSQGLSTTLQASLANVPKLLSDEGKSSDTSTALLFSGGKTQVDLYESYLAKSRADSQNSTVQDFGHYTPILTSDDLPYTDLGMKARLAGIDPSDIVTLRQNFAKILQLLALAGVLYAIYRVLRKKPHTLGLDFICLNMAGLALLAVLVVMPILSVNYGVLRAFQQILIFLVLPIIMLLIRISQLWRNRFSAGLATVCTVSLFLLFTGVFAQVLGGVSPSLSMNNKGLYYGLYYSSAVDRQSFVWLRQHLPARADARAANFNRAIMHDPDYPFSKTAILPLQITPDSYVYLDASQVQRHKFYVYHESSPMIMELAPDYYDLAKNQIYSTTSTRVYK